MIPEPEPEPGCFLSLKFKNINVLRYWKYESVIQLYIILQPEIAEYNQNDLPEPESKVSQK